jgi:nucleoside-diphosphate-sugar epimerase
MTNTDKTVLITGATGRQGGAVIRHLLPKGWKLRALTRDPGSHSARSLKDNGVEVVQGDRTCCCRRLWRLQCPGLLGSGSQT